MAPQRTADAAVIAPYLTNIVSHHGQLTLIPPDNAGRVRKLKSKKSRTNVRPINDTALHNSAPRVVKIHPQSPGRAANSRRTTRTPTVRPGEQQNHTTTYDDDIPDYPPPSFQEAISTPAFPSEMPTSPSTAAPTCSPIQSAESDSNSDSDSDGSMELLYLDSVRQEFASQSHLNLQDESRGRSPIRELDREEESIPSSPQKKRNMSLSPLRTLFPPKHLNLRERTMSAHPSSPYSRSTSFFRSTTSLKSLSGSSMLPSTPTSISGKESLLSFFSSKGKERDERESMDSWVVLETGPEEPQSLMEILESASRHPVPRSWPSSPNDRVSFPPENPRPSPGPSRLQPQGDQHIPPMTPVPILRQPARRYPASSPIQRSMLHIPTELDLDTRTTPVSPSTLPLQPQAVETQSPYTPVELLPVSHSAPGTLVQVSAHRPLLQPLQPVSMTASSRNPMSPSLRSSQSTPTDSTTPTQIVPSGQHYLGRPLPRPPPNSSSTPRTSVDRTKRREVVDSVYASSSETSSVSAPSCPETPLIDFGDSDSITDSDSDSSTPVNTFQAQRSSSASPSSPAAISQRPQASQAATNFSQFTDLDLLVSRLDEAAGQRGLNYDNLLLVSEFLGDANVSKPPSTAILPARIGKVTVERRRVLRDGRVKLKLTLLNAKVDKCGICLGQFKEGESGALGRACLHPFHEKCLGRWLEGGKKSTCPTCRTVLV